ncbi:MAG: glycosyltransferase [Chlorobiota bacterium]
MSDKIKVLHVSHFPHYKMGGQKSMLALMENLDSKQVENYGLTTDIGELTDKFDEMGVKYFTIPLTKLSLNNIFKVIRNALEIRRICNKNKIDIIHSDYERDGFLCGLATLGTKTKSVWHVRVTNPNNLDNLNYKLSDKLICISEGARKRFVDNEEKTKVIFNGVDCSLFKPVVNKDELKSELGMESNKFTTLFVGQMKIGKGIYEIIETAKMLPDVEFILLGEFLNEIEKSNWLNKVDELGIRNIEWLGQKQGIHKWMQAADCLLLPSYEGAEGMGRVVFEAMACGTPPIASNISGVNEAVTIESGILIPEKDSDAIANAVKELFDNKDIWEELSINGRKRALDTFDIRIHAEKVSNLYKELLD